MMNKRTARKIGKRLARLLNKTCPEPVFKVALSRKSEAVYVYGGWVKIRIAGHPAPRAHPYPADFEVGQHVDGAGCMTTYHEKTDGDYIDAAAWLHDLRTGKVPQRIHRLATERNAMVDAYTKKAHPGRN